MKCALAAVVADTPACQLLLGFKEGVNFAKLPCRHCTWSQTSGSGHGLLRDMEKHITDHCAGIDFGEKLERKKSVLYGVNRLSPFFDLPHFDVLNVPLKMLCTYYLKGSSHSLFNCCLKFVYLKKNSNLSN